MPPAFAAMRWLPLAAAILGSACSLSSNDFTARSGAVVADTAADQRALRLAAWADQIAFERFRIQYLPEFLSPTDGFRQQCNEAVGRFCLAPGSATGAWRFIRESPRIAERRLDLVHALRDVGRRIPQDDWVIGQWVRYAVESELYPEAMEAALGCIGTDWWCAALVGYVMHRSGNSVEAERAFAMALGAMTPDERLRWMDPAPLLPRDVTDSLRVMPEAALYPFIDLFWHLADPFLTRPGNEILMEHLSRRVELQFQYAAGFVEGTPWDEDLEGIHLRYGTPWSRIAGTGVWHHEIRIPAIFLLGPPFGVPDLISNYRVPAIELLPPAEDLQPGKGDWDAVNRAPPAGYNISVEGRPVRWLSPPEHQVAVFHRGESAVVVTAFDPAAHNLAADSTLEYGFAYLPMEDLLSPPIAARGNGAAGTAPLLVAIPPQTGLMSLEIISRGEAAVARSRRPLGITPRIQGAPGISDILLIDGEARPESLSDAVAVARKSNRVQVGERVGLFWEIYGVDPATHPEVAITLSLIPEQPGLLGRLGRVLGIGPGTTASQIRWQEETSPGSEMPRFIALTIPELRDGTHLLELMIEVADHEPVVAWKEVVVGGSVVRELPQGELTRRPLLRRILCGKQDELLEVGNEENLRISQEHGQAHMLREQRANAWEFPEVDVPRGFSCTHWVMFRREYFGQGEDFW